MCARKFLANVGGDAVKIVRMSNVTWEEGFREHPHVGFEPSGRNRGNMGLRDGKEEGLGSPDPCQQQQDDYTKHHE
jgi:hypothetical protein